MKKLRVNFKNKVLNIHKTIISNKNYKLCEDIQEFFKEEGFTTSLSSIRSTSGTTLRIRI